MINIQNVDEKDNMITDSIEYGEKELLSWNYDEALEKIGVPISTDSFRIIGLPEFRVELYN